MSHILSRFIEFKRTKNLSHKAIAEICGVTPNAITEALSGRMKSIPLYWLENIIEAYDLDANYFFRKGATLQPFVANETVDFRSIPFLGRIAAGLNKNSEEMPGEGFLVPTFMLPKKRPYFALQISGDSMIGAGIFDGDICIIEQQNNPAILKHGDIAAFRVDGDATLKYFHKNKDQAWLVPANPDYKAIPLNAGQQVELIGPFVSLLRPPN